MDVMLIGFQRKIFWGPSLWMRILKVGWLDILSILFASHAEAMSCELLLVVWCCAGHGVYGESAYQPFLPFQCGYFLIYLIYKNHSVSFWISLRDHCSICSYTFSMSVEGRRFRSLQVIAFWSLLSPYTVKCMYLLFILIRYLQQSSI